MKGIYTFTAGFRRDNEKETKQLANCATHEGYLCRVNGKNLRPIWNSAALEKAGISQQETEQYTDIHAALQAGKGHLLVKFGKQDGYWVWNVEAAKKKKLESDKTVYIYERKSDEFDDEGTLCLGMREYPKEVKEAILKNTTKQTGGYGRTYYEINNYLQLSADLQEIGWKLNK
jgi:hypothetical protein